MKKWFYNPQGSVIEHWSYVEGEELTSGIDITETMYDNRGNAIKSFAYNSLDASTKFYQEQELAEDGRVLADIDETGSHKTYYEYDDVIGKVKTATAPNGGKFSYAHDTNTDEVSAITQSTENGEANVTNRVYTAGYLTELSSGGNTINFEYDQKGRKSAVYLNGTAPYAVYEYQERKEADETDAVAINETATATIAPTDSVSSYTVKAERDKDGNLLKVSEGKNSESLAESTINTYFSSEDKDREGLLKTSEDRISKTKTEYTYNSLKQPTSAIVRDSDTNAVISSETAEYNAYGEVAKRQITSGGYTQEYGYGYKDNFERELERITMPYGLSSARITDANGRLTERVLTLNGEKLGGEYYYFRKHGDHGTNQISSVRYGERKNKEYVIKDGISYAYDSCGNISEVKENGKLSLRYGYDKLNRLIREDNVKLNKTTLFTYDNNGNILSKRETDFCMREAENIIEFKDEKEYTYDALYPDKLMSFGDEGISGYDAIGNPTSYRGKIFTWQKGRQLASVTDAADTLSFSYDAHGRRMGKSAAGERTKYFYAGDMLIREERCDDNNTLYFGDDLFAGNNFIDGDEIFIDSVNKSVLEYIYGQDGVVGLVYNGAKYYFRRNIQGDITRIYGIDGTLAACYTYDAWGNHKVFDAEGKENTDLGFIGNINPYRYRGYYFDTETGLYYCKSRYYDPEIGRWINADDVAYLGPESINGLNLYAYCLNNPVMYVDPTGQFLISFLIGLAIAAAIGAGVGATVGGISAAVNGEDIGKGILNGALLGGLFGASIALVFSGVGAGIGGGIWSAIAIGAGVGSAVGLGVNVNSQLENGGIGSLNLGQAVGSWFGGLAVGAVAGAMGHGLSALGAYYGQAIGISLASKTFLGAKIASVFSFSLLYKAGSLVGSAIGGFIGGHMVNYLAKDSGIQSHNIPLWLISIFKFLGRK